MRYKAVLFDLDGTLLPMDQDEFTKAYFKTISQKLAPNGYQPDALIKKIWAGTLEMIKNTGDKTNEQVFWDFFGDVKEEDTLAFNEYYKNEFNSLKAICGYTPKAYEAVSLLKSCGVRVGLATNPLFPSAATESRIRWAGFEIQDFEFFTTYENSCRCKPNPDYYRDVLKLLDLDASDCLMVGNDVGDDMVARKIGMDVFLLTDCLINKQGEDISVYPSGGFDELIAYLKSGD